MGNQFFCGQHDKIFNPTTYLCRRVCGLDDNDVYDAEFGTGCDPAGAVFDDTIRHLDELEQLAFRFAGSSNLAALRWVFCFGATPEVCDSNGTTLLHVAARTGSLPVVKDLVRRGFDPNTTDSAGWTPLHVSSCMGRKDVSLYLLQSGSQPSVLNARGQTAQDLCSHPWTKEIVIAYGADGKPHVPEVGFPTRDDLNLPDFEMGGASSSCPGMGASLYFEPFFVPRRPILHEPALMEELQRLGIEIFNGSPGHGLAFIIAAGAVRDHPVDINMLLVRIGADPLCLSEFLGEDLPLSQTLRLEFLNKLPLLGTGVVTALEVAFRHMSIPNSLLKVDRLIRGIAHFWWRQHEEDLQDNPEGITDNMFGLHCVGLRGELAGLELQRLLLGTESLHRLMFSTVMLHKWVQSGKVMSLNEWIQLNTGIEGTGNDVPIHVQTGIYKALLQLIADEKVSLSRHLEPLLLPGQPPVPAMKGWAYVYYSGRAQMSTGAHPAAWPDASPRALAAQGGASSVGMASPLPEPPDEALVRGKPLACPFDAGSTKPCCEAAWLCLHKTLLLFAQNNASKTPPYAFISVRHTIVRETEASARRLVLAARPDPDKPELQWPPLVNGDDEWLELCLLLGDGRFQPLEAPSLELRFSTDREYDEWVARLWSAIRSD
mmetsp:Transcript_12604/g.21917  ORF Transcript_12604/g.21917 Transcript_12604/m.21917 type:complete len:658 (-) Transcript_12604:165-2138(-)